MKKNHARQLTLKKYSCYGKKNSYKEFDNEKKKKNSCGSKIPLPLITFLMVRPLYLLCFVYFYLLFSNGLSRVQPNSQTLLH